MKRHRLRYTTLTPPTMQPPSDPPAAEYGDWGLCVMVIGWRLWADEAGRVWAERVIQLR